MTPLKVMPSPLWYGTARGLSLTGTVPHTPGPGQGPFCTNVALLLAVQDWPQVPHLEPFGGCVIVCPRASISLSKGAPFWKVLSPFSYFSLLRQLEMMAITLDWISHATVSQQ